jgi:hypothetical protein
MDERFLLIRDWYMAKFPDDDLGTEINSELSFSGLFVAMNEYKDVYEIMGVHDSIIRERMFEKLATIMRVPYMDVYEQWLKCR